MKNKKIPISIFLSALILVFSIFYSCNKEDENNITSSSVSSIGITGQWQFEITPWFHYLDTTLLKGRRASDFSFYSSINDEIYLFESNNQIRGFTGPIEFRGTISDTIRLDVYEPVDGKYGVDTTKIKSAEMKLKQNSFGFLEGWAKIILDRDSIGIIKDTYKISGKKIGNISDTDFNNLKLRALNSWLDKLCDAVGDVMSYVCSIFSGGVVRPMANCWGNKDGGGFWAVGNEGPGSLFPIWTVTAYYPLEWASCKVRVYNFNINYDGNVRGINELKDLVRAQAEWASLLGYHYVDTLVNHIQDFYNIYGDFAISIAFDSETKGISLYANNANGNTNAHNDKLCRNILDFIGPKFSSYSAVSGRNISDSWHLRRSDFFVCNSPLSITYLFGTAKINYN
jgi:hypothetical protein